MTGPPRHFTGLDAFRGIAVAAMIVVNNPGTWGAVYPPLSHAAWNGWTAADLIFPAFVFVVGVTVPIALGRRVERVGRGRALVHVAIRAVVLIGFGLLLNVIAAAPNFDRVRVPGVLQRIALAFAIAAPIVVSAGPKVWAGAIALFLAVHTVFLFAVPLPGYPSGVGSPSANLPGAVDAWLFGAAHLHTPTMDPEGLLGTLPTAATLLCGALAGRWLQAAPTAARRGGGLIVGGTVAIAIGLAWAPMLPLNKSIWTGSFAIASAGVAAVGLGVCLLLVKPPDRVPDRTAWFAPFLWLGVNPLAIYILSEIVRAVLDFPWLRAGAARVGVKDLIFWRLVAPAIGDAGGPRSSLIFALAIVAVWIGVAGVLHRKGIRFRI